jgi:Cd2+/Zn2+-exporting ATPase
MLIVPMSLPTFSASGLSKIIKEHPDAIAAMICGLLVCLGWLSLDIGWRGMGLLLLFAAYVIGGYERARQGLTTLLKKKEFDVDLLMLFAAVGAASLGVWKREYNLIIDGVILILIFAISGALESYALQRTERSIRTLMNLTSDQARVISGGIEQFIPVDQLQVSNKILVKPGELIPTDAIIIEGSSSINQESITGESIPVKKRVGDQVFAGTINGMGVLKVIVHQSPESSMIQRIIRMVEEAKNEKPPSQNFLEKFERPYAFVIIFTGFLLGSLPHFILGWDWERTIYRALIFLVVASPCALMAAIMPTLLSGISNGARHGILFKNGAQLEKIGQVRAIAFDKTGTLTTGKPQVINFIPAIQQSETQLIQIAAALESLSEHPIGYAIVQAAKEQQLTWSNAIKVQAITGRGIIGIIDNKQAAVGKLALIQEQVKDIPINLIIENDRLENIGKTVIWVAYDQVILGIIVVADTVRKKAAHAIAALKKMGIEKVIMLTGDNYITAQNIANEIGIDVVYAELLPTEKVKAIRDLQKQYKTVAMVGDGINDAPAIALANVGIAMGLAGSYASLETADVVLMADKLEKLELAISLGRRSQRIVKQNIVFALSFIVILLAANFWGDITLPFGVICHEGSTVIVTLNGLRLLRN